MEHGVLFYYPMGDKMPNWCRNKLKIIGSGQEFLRIKELVKKELVDPEGYSVFMFDQIFLGFDEFDTLTDDQLTEKYGFSFTESQRKLLDHRMRLRLDKYNWCIEADGLLVLDFLSAWGPPKEEFLILSKFFTHLTFKMVWAEPNMDWSGRFLIRHGKVFNEVRNSYEDRDVWFKETEIFRKVDLAAIGRLVE